MPRAFLMKPRPLEQVPVTSESSSDIRQTSSVDVSSWLQVDYDVNNNNVSRSSSSTLFGPARLDRPTDNLAQWPFHVAGGLQWWPMPESRSSAASAQPGPMFDKRGGQGRYVMSTKRSPPPSATAAAESMTAGDDDVQHLWWSPSPHSDVSGSGMTTFIRNICIVTVLLLTVCAQLIVF